MCTLSLSTPLLFSAGYRASTLHKSDAAAHERLADRIVSHLQLALKNVNKYSVSAADDVITAIRELCDQQCAELLPHVTHTSDSDGESLGSDGVLAALLLAYSSHPKSAPGRTVDRAPWKVSVVTVMTDIYRLAHSTYNSSSSTSSGSGSGSSGGSSEAAALVDEDQTAEAAARFTEAFVEISVTDFLSIHRVMGGKPAPSGTLCSTLFYFTLLHATLFCTVRHYQVM